MIEETAVVVEVDEQRVLLETQRKSTCQSCAVQSGCGTSTLAKVVGKRSTQFCVEKILDLQVGDQVIVAVDENALVQGSLLIYFFPLIFMMLAGIIAELWFSHEPTTIVFSVLGFIVSMVIVRFVFTNSALKQTVQPHLIRKV